MTETIVRAPPGVTSNQPLTAKSSPPSPSAWQANGEANPAFFLPGLAKDKSEKSSDSESITKKKKKQDSGVSGDSHSEHSDSNNDSKLNEKIKESLSKRIKSKEQITQEREKIEKLIKTAGDNITNSINQAINKNNKNSSINSNINSNSIQSMAGSKREKTISIDQTQSPILAKKIKVENTDESSEENINVDVVGSSDDEHRLSNAESNDSTIHSGSQHPGNMNFPGLQQFHSLLANHNLNSNSLIQQNQSNFTTLPMSSRQRLFAQAETQRRRASRKERIKIRLDELMKQVRYLQREYNKTEAEHLSTSSSSDPESSDEQAVNLLSSIALPGFEHTGLEKLIKKEITNVLVRVREQMTSASFKASGISSNGSTPELMSPSDRLSSPTLSGSDKSHKPTAAEELMKAQAAQAAQTIMPQIKNALKLNVPKFNMLPNSGISNGNGGINSGISNSGISSVTRTLSVQPNHMSPKISSLAQTLVSPVQVAGNQQNNQILQNANQLLQTQNSLSAQILPNSQIHAQITPQITPSATPVPQQPTQSQISQAQLNQASLNQAQINQAQLNQAQLNQSQLNQTQLQQSQITQQTLTAQQSVGNAPTNTYAYLKQQQLQAQQAQQQLQSQQLQAQQQQQLQQQAAQNQISAQNQQAASAAAQNPQTNVANAAATQAYQQAYQKALLAAKLSQAQAAQDSLLGRNSGMMNRLPTFGEQMASLQEGYAGYDISDIYGNIHKVS